jgi:putative N6-adenine-specific DNA methylase
MPLRMTRHTDFEIFLAAAPGLEPVLAEEARSKAFKQPAVVAGGVVIRGGWPDVWRANLWLRGANRVLARIAAFRVAHLAHLDDLAHKVPWAEVLRPGIPVHVEASCAGSRIWHSGAAAERIGTAIRDTIGVPISAEAEVTVMARIEKDHCTISVDTSGELLHRRGHKEEVNRAPLRETMAALFLMQCSYDGSEPMLDPMCGSGTFVIEAAEIAARLNPGRSRRFAFEKLASFDDEAWQKLRAARRQGATCVLCHGSDRDAGAIAMSRANAERAGVAGIVEFRQCAISEIVPPEGPPGLVIANPPYGTRMGDKAKLLPLYQTFGRVLRERFAGWRVGMLASERRLAEATGLPWLPPGPPVPHGGLRVTLYRTGPL